MSVDSSLTHINTKGDACMVDVGGKQVTKRKAIAQGSILMKKETLDMIIKGEHKKGDVLSIARIAGIMAAKKTSELIPLCHPVMLTTVAIDLQIDENQSAVVCQAVTGTTERTGVEIEALLAVQAALLTIYDMCKAVDKGMTLQDVHLLYKSGGRSGKWSRIPD